MVQKVPVYFEFEVTSTAEHGSVLFGVDRSLDDMALLGMSFQIGFCAGGRLSHARLCLYLQTRNIQVLFEPYSNR